MADSPAFCWVCEEIERATRLNRLEARGTVRLTLKEAGFDPGSVNRVQMRTILERMMPGQVADQRPVEERRHQQPGHLALEGDRTVLELEERGVEPGAGGHQRGPGERLPLGELIVVEEHLDEDVLSEEPGQQDREGAPVPTAKDLAAKLGHILLEIDDLEDGVGPDSASLQQHLALDGDAFVDGSLLPHPRLAQEDQDLLVATERQGLTFGAEPPPLLEGRGPR